MEVVELQGGRGPLLATPIQDGSLEEAGHTEVPWVGEPEQQSSYLGEASGLVSGLVSKAGFSVSV